eukprot:TRINITY_DN54679_c0_g1_i1.p1 TRINITY_DN54679_c0_g1~~TRINITY_DN54679_c0_g1_i1.p1  ORF type:complete len:1269 (-),score=183.77 TRINITY_DN54679_c0_g1_i1:20-3259(-)
MASANPRGNGGGDCTCVWTKRTGDQPCRGASGAANVVIADASVLGAPNGVNVAFEHAVCFEEAGKLSSMRLGCQSLAAQAQLVSPLIANRLQQRKVTTAQADARKKVVEEQRVEKARAEEARVLEARFAEVQQHLVGLTGVEHELAMAQNQSKLVRAALIKERQTRHHNERGLSMRLASVDAEVALIRERVAEAKLQFEKGRRRCPAQGNVCDENGKARHRPPRPSSPSAGLGPTHGADGFCGLGCGTERQRHGKTSILHKWLPRLRPAVDDEKTSQRRDGLLRPSTIVSAGGMCCTSMGFDALSEQARIASENARPSSARTSSREVFQWVDKFMTHSDESPVPGSLSRLRATSESQTELDKLPERGLCAVGGSKMQSFCDFPPAVCCEDTEAREQRYYRVLRDCASFRSRDLCVWSDKLSQDIQEMRNTLTCAVHSAASAAKRLPASPRRRLEQSKQGGLWKQRVSPALHTMAQRMGAIVREAGMDPVTSDVFASNSLADYEIACMEAADEESRAFAMYESVIDRERVNACLVWVNLQLERVCRKSSLAQAATQEIETASVSKSSLVSTLRDSLRLKRGVDAFERRGGECCADFTADNRSAKSASQEEPSTLQCRRRELNSESSDGGPTGQRRRRAVTEAPQVSSVVVDQLQAVASESSHCDSKSRLSTVKQYRSPKRETSPSSESLSRRRPPFGLDMKILAAGGNVDFDAASTEVASEVKRLQSKITTHFGHDPNKRTLEELLRQKRERQQEALDLRQRLGSQRLSAAKFKQRQRLALVLEMSDRVCSLVRRLGAAALAQMMAVEVWAHAVQAQVEWVAEALRVSAPPTIAPPPLASLLTSPSSRESCGAPGGWRMGGSDIIASREDAAWLPCSPEASLAVTSSRMLQATTSACGDDPHIVEKVADDCEVREGKDTRGSACDCADLQGNHILSSRILLANEDEKHFGDALSIESSEGSTVSHLAGPSFRSNSIFGQNGSSSACKVVEPRRATDRQVRCGIRHLALLFKPNMYVMDRGDLAGERSACSSDSDDSHQGVRDLPDGVRALWALCAQALAIRACAASELALLRTRSPQLFQ